AGSQKHACRGGGEPSAEERGYGESHVVAAALRRASPPAVLGRPSVPDRSGSRRPGGPAARAVSRGGRPARRALSVFHARQERARPAEGGNAHALLQLPPDAVPSPACGL